MKLRNKKTGGIGTLSTNAGSMYVVLDKNGVSLGGYDSLAEVCEGWEDYDGPEEYWFLNSLGEATRPSNTDDWTPEGINYHKRIGNYFETKGEAEKAVEKLKAWRRLKNYGFRFTGWKRDEVHYGDITITAGDWLSVDDKDLDLLFGGEE